MADTRIEAILENILGADNEILPPMSRNEVLLIQIMDMLQEDIPNTVITSAQIDSIINSIS
jgi:hypothetical protein